ncbi:MAG: FtsQ-type POTRA domain-containing protein [Gammaproteobacteria bacterium]|nr:FtsQ-type POTRA domain-containing protein [Gammaproteobacteria bacterium]
MLVLILELGQQRMALVASSLRRKQGASRVNRPVPARHLLAALLPGDNAARWLRRVFWLGFLMLCAVAGNQAWHALRNVPVGAVDIFGYSGDENNSRGATEEEIYLLMDDHLDQGYWDIDLGELRMALESHRWIRRASVLRRWPNRLQIQVDEHLPVARWNNTHLLASSAELIPVANNGGFASLPQFTTPGIFSHSRSDIKLMVDQYNRLQKILAPHFLSIRQLGSALGSDIWLVLQNGTRVELGEKNHLIRLQRLVDMVSGGVIDSWASIAIADLRYAHGLSLRRNTAPEAAAEPAQEVGGKRRRAVLPPAAQRNKAVLRLSAAHDQFRGVNLMHLSGARHV